jgi:hypothetical protein
MKPRHLIPAILALLLAYPLSIGPVGKWYYPRPRTQYTSAVEAFYRPLFVLCGHLPFGWEVMGRYLQLWGVDFVAPQ